MSDLIVKFIGKEYSIPQDVLTYIELLNFTDNVQKQLANTFVRKLKIEIQKNNTGLLGDEDLAEEIEQQVGKYIAKLCDHGIFTRTIGDYLNNNKGYQYVSDVNKAALEKFKSLLMQRLDSLQEGYTDAVQRAESHVTGMGFSIWSGSFVNHAIYAAMQASTINKQEKEASASYQREINELCTKLESDYDRQTSQYIHNEYIPNMEAAFTVLAYELLDRYVVDLIDNGKFNKAALDFVNIGRSNDLLKNLTLSNNKQAILENAFAACPYNIAVYMQAMKLDFLDYDSFQAAKLFKQDQAIISFLKDNLGSSHKSEKRQLHFKSAELLSLYTDTPLRKVTAYMADYIINGYSQTVALLSNKAQCRNIMKKVAENDVLAGDTITKEKVNWLVDPLAPALLWKKLTTEYGHEDLLQRLPELWQGEVKAVDKDEYDSYLKNRLFSAFEDIRLDLVKEISERKIEEQKQQAIAAEKARIAAEKKKKFIKYGLIVGSVAIVAIIAIFLITSYFSTISNIEEYISEKQYEHAFDAVNSSNLSKTKKQEYRTQLIPFMQENISKDIEQYELINADNYSVYLESNEIIVRDKNGKGLLFYKGGNRKILDEVLYANGYVFFVEASDNFGYSVYYISIDEGNRNHIDTFDEFDRLVKLDDGRILIDSLNSDDMYVMFDPYKLTTKTVDPSSDHDQMNIVYDTNTYGYKKDEGNVFAPQDFSNCVVGDVIQLGRYEQDGNIRNGNEPIDWIVLKIQDGKAFLVSKYALDAQQYDKGYSQDTNWENCWLREWLNDDFLTAAFNSEECSIISGTQDKLFLLSIDDAKKYFSSDAERQCKLTEYAEQQGASSIDGYCWWWLQPAEKTATVVGYKGDICDYGNYVHIDSDEYAVRPAMWIEIDEYSSDKQKIEYASKILGRRCDESGNISLNADLGNFINGDNPLFGEDGHFELGAYSEDSKGLKIDTLDWVSNGKVKDFSKIVAALQTLYGEPFYTNAIANEYAWSDVGIYEEILCVRNNDKIATIRWVYRVSDPENQSLDESLKTDLEKMKEYASYIKGAEANVLKDYPHFEDDGDTYYQCEDQVFGISGYYKFEYFEGKISSVRFTWIPSDWHNDEEYVVDCLKKCFGDFTGYSELLDDEWFCYSWEDTTADNLKISYYIAEDEGEILIRVN